MAIFILPFQELLEEVFKHTLNRNLGILAIVMERKTSPVLLPSVLLTSYHTMDIL
jgi:hypothetical protein